MRNIFIFLLVSLLYLILSKGSFAGHVDKEYILKLLPNKSSTALNYFHQKNDSDKEIIKNFEMGAYHVRLGEKEREEFVKLYSSDIKYLEPNITYSINSTPSKQWALDNDKGTHIDALKAWEISKGSKEVVVGIIDTGVDYTHPALKNNMWLNKLEIADNGIDDDDNGYIDDVKGWDFANEDNDPIDDHNHGTHCAGVIAANSSEVVGIAPKVTIMPLKFLTKYGGGSLAGAINAIEYGTRMGANILSNSWGGGGYTAALEEAIQAAERKGVLFVAAAGNEYNNNDNRPTYPATYEVANIVAVAASTIDGGKAYFSNYGKETVHLFAPGYDIYSTVKDGGYQSMSGTSMATPYVSGVAALIMSKYPGISYEEVKERMMNGVKTFDAFEELVISGGLLNAYQSLK